MHRKAALAALALAAVAVAQQAGNYVAEVHPNFKSQTCTTAAGCVPQNTQIVLDANWRWVHATNSATNCFSNGAWNPALCPDGASCASNCALEGADYTGTYGITSGGSSLTLQLVTGSNVGSRVYLMASNTKYQILKLLNQEFTFDVDVSNLPCGLNGAVYLVQMDADGGQSKYPKNRAGAKYGTGYCDAQCPKDVQFINGEANIDGEYGSCCSEMDIWEANSASAAFTPHPCETTGQTRCSGDDCTGDTGLCDADGCDFNSFRLGAQNFFGYGKAVDTSRPFTVVTQFITDDNTPTGSLSQIRRLYVQDNQVVQNSVVNIPGIPAVNDITDDFCTAQKSAFGDTDYFAQKGGLAQMGDALERGMVLVFSIWDDHAANMLWLDSDYPTTADTSSPGVARGSCPTTSGVPADIEAQSPMSRVIFSNLKWGDIDSTYSYTPPSGTVGQWGQCGGIDYHGSTTCASPFTCVVINDYYSECQ